jgi:hypothetical protein
LSPVGNRDAAIYFVFRDDDVELKKIYKQAFKMQKLLKIRWTTCKRYEGKTLMLYLYSTSINRTTGEDR